MSDLISRADAIEAVAEEWLSEASAESPYVNDDDIGAYKKLAEELFADIPSADRPQGEWIRHELWKQPWYTCSICEYHGRNDFNYCPNCGAKMGADK